LNITVTNTTGSGFITVWPEGGTFPTVSTLNFVAGQTIANAAIVPSGTGGGISVVAGVHGTDLIIDINGYFSSTLGNASNFFDLENNSTSRIMQLVNDSSSCSGACGLWAQTQTGTAVQGDASSTTDGTIGVRGNALGATGITFGVYGQSLSATHDSAGVFGTDKDGPAAPTGSEDYAGAGVRGESISGVGLVGVSQNEGGVGSLVASNGDALALGFFGCGDCGGGNWGVFAGGNIGATGTKPFVEVHPTDPSKLIRYVALEGPEAGTYFRGRARFINGSATIPVPESFRLVTDAEGLTVQITPIGEPVSFAVVSAGLDEIVVRGSQDTEFFYMVNGVRQTFKDWQVIVDGGYTPNSPKQKLPLYFSEEQKRRLVANGTYNPDGTVNMGTAERLGWTKKWAEREQALKEAAARASLGISRGDQTPERQH
jgi:hypothetical protein